MEGILILFFIGIGAVMGVIFWQRRKRIKRDIEKGIDDFKDKLGV